MTGRLVRGFCTAAAAAVAAGSLVAGTPAYARPGSGPPAEPGPAAGSGARAGTADRDRAAPARPRDADQGPVEALLKDLQRRYAQAEAAEQSYRATRRRLKRRRGTAGSLEKKLAEARRALHDSRAAAGRLARMQYQGSSTALSPYVRLLLARDPQHALAQGHMLQRVSAARALVVRRLADDERRAHALASTARHALEKQEALAERQRRKRDAAQERLRTVEQRLAALGAGPGSSARRHAATGTEHGKGGGHGAPGSSSGVPESARALLAKALDGARPPSRAGAEALRYALRQLGKPYRWGATGPDAFDCSGLTSQAWAHAGRTIPRTSQAQWKGLTRVPMDRLRPGDLVVYYPTATHVALYAGGGMVVQAPRPGKKVEVSPVDANPVLGAVRPDA